MPAQRGTLTIRVGAALVAVVLLAGCSSAPVSEASEAPSIASSVAPSEAAASSAPSSSGPASSSPSAAPASPVVADAPPPKPGNPTFKLVKETPGPGGTATDEYRITWTSPKGVADSFLIYGLPDCLRYSKKYDNKPCVVRGMRIPSEKLELLATVPGDERSARVSWDIGEIGPGPYSAILIRATNSAGNSIFTIVNSDNVCFKCVY